MKRIIFLEMFLYFQAILLAQNTCINSGFENGNFSNWSGSKGSSHICGDSVTKHPVYTLMSTGIFSTYINANIKDTSALHSIMDNSGNISTSSGNYYMSIPFDTFAVNSSSVHEIPFVCPFFSDSFSVRLNNINTNFRAAQLTYTITNACTKKLDYAFAVVLNDGGHSPGSNPYFMVKIFDQSWNALDSTTITLYSGDTSLKPSAIAYSNSVWYRKWEKKSIDFSLPTYSNVSTAYIQFTSGSCCYGGHFGYAYIDAQCSVITNSCVLEVSDIRKENFNLSPNPVSDFIQISGNNRSDNDVYYITDLTGRVLKKGKLKSEDDKIFVSSIEDGVYFLIIENTSGILCKKFVLKKQ